MQVVVKTFTRIVHLIAAVPAPSHAITTPSCFLNMLPCYQVVQGLKFLSETGSLVEGLAREVRALPIGLIRVDVVDVTLCAHILDHVVVEGGDPGDAAGLLTGVAPGHVELQAGSTSSSSPCQRSYNQSRAS